MRIFKPKWKVADGTWREGKNYSVQFSVGGKLHRKTLKTRDKRVAQMRALQIVEREEKKAVGLASPFEEHMERPVADHVAVFESYLKHRGVSQGHLEDRKLCLREYMEAVAPRTISAIDLVTTQRWLSEVAEKLSARSVNKRFQSLRQFGRWLVTTKRCGDNPFKGLSARDEETDRRRVRRALTDDELQRLLDVARNRPVERALIKRTRTGVTPAQRVKLLRLGEARAFLYEMAAGTGLRRGELKGLTWADLDLDAATLTVRAKVAKSKKRQELPVRKDLVDGLADHRDRVEAGGFAVGARDPVFPGRLFPTHKTFQADLVAAKLDGEDDQGRVVDFHSFRVTFITRLSQAGVHPRTAQALARHSKLDLTMGVYTDARLLDLRGAVEATPSHGTRRAAEA